MDLLVYLCYPILALFLFWGAKVYRRGEWNEEFLSLSQTKALQGFCAVAIMLHHISQKTCASWLNEKVIVPGLDVFVSIGYWFVGIFLFCSGYGLFKSVKNKKDYFDGFFVRRILPLIVAFVTASICFQIARARMGVIIHVFSSPFQLGGPDLADPYAWYMILLPVLYFGFYVAFRFCKKDITAILITCIVAVLYIAFCDFWMYGSWWYNSILPFIVGIIIAKYEQEIIAKWKKNYVILLLCNLLLAIAFHLLAENTVPVFSTFHWNTEHELFRLVRTLAQMLSCAFATLAIFMAGMKIRIGNKALAFMGTITLEFYLIHGLYVQLFGYCFMDDFILPVYYIKNVALFVLVVLVLALISAFLLHLANKLIIKVVLKQKRLMKVVKRDAKRLIVILLAIFVLGTVFISITVNGKVDDTIEIVEKYGKEIITYADVNGQKMAAYVAGEGENTIVILRGPENPCPTLTLKPIADDLAKYNHVVVLDYFGNGFSDDTNRERSAENIVDEIHTALESLGEKGPFILMPMELSVAYAQIYAEMYPDEVKAMVGFDGNVAEQMQEMIRVERINVGDFCRRERKYAKMQSMKQKLFRICGYTDMQWHYFESLFYHTHTDTEMSVMRELLRRKLYSRNIVEEMTYGYESTMKLLNHKFASDLPVLMILDYYNCSTSRVDNENSYLVNPKLDWQYLHENQFSNPEIQKIQVISGDPYVIYYNPHAVSQIVQEYIDQLKSCR